MSREIFDFSASSFHFGRFLILLLYYSIISFFFVSKIVVSFETEPRSSYSDSLFSIANLIIAVVFVSYSLSTRSQQLNMAFFWLFQYIFFGLGGLLVQIDPFPYYLTQTSTSSLLQSTAKITLLAQISVGIGQIFGFISKRTQSTENIAETIEKEYYVLKRIKYLIVVYLLTAPFIINELGGAGFLLKRVRFGSSEQMIPIPLNAILQTLIYVPPLVGLVTLIYFSRFRKKNQFVLTLLLIWILFLSNPFGNARQVTLFLTFPLLFIYLRQRVYQSLFFFAGLPILFLYSAGLINRYTGQFQAPHLSIISRDGDFDSFSQVANGLQSVDSGIFPPFRQITGSILFFVPRSVYPNKPNDTGMEIARYLGLKFQNLSAPWILEAYVNARFLGIIVVGIGLGFFLTLIDLNSILNLRNFLLSSMTSGFLFILLRGSLLQATGRAAFTYFLIYLLIRNPNGRSRAFTAKD